MSFTAISIPWSASKPSDAPGPERAPVIPNLIGSAAEEKPEANKSQHRTDTLKKKIFPVFMVSPPHPLNWVSELIFANISHHPGFRTHLLSDIEFMGFGQTSDAQAFLRGLVITFSEFPKGSPPF
jgi:hypothetical protein